MNTDKTQEATSPVEVQGLTNNDIWFVRNLECLLGGEITLVKKGKKEKINKEMLAEWILSSR